LLVKIKRDLENQIRGLLKNVGLVIGRAKFNVFAVRAEELIEDRPELIAVVGPLLKARQAIKQQTERCSQLSLLIEVKLTLSRSSRSLFSDDHKRCPSTPGRSCQNSERV
jgi:transposase